MEESKIETPVAERALYLRVPVRRIFGRIYRMNVLQLTNVAIKHLVHVFPGFGMGGSQSRFVQFVRAISGRYRHTILSLDGTLEMARHIPADGAVEVSVPAFDKRSGPENWVRHRSLLRELKPDILVTYNWGAMDWCISNRFLPLSAHVHIEDGFGPEEKDRQLKRRVWTRRIVLSGAHSTVVVPSRQLERLALRVWKIPETSLRYIPNGIDCARFYSPGRNPGSGPFVIGTIATLRAEKNLERLIRLFTLFAGRSGRESRLIIVGDGPERSKLEEAARGSPFSKQIVFTGASDHPERELAQFDIFALTSDTEQMPLSVLEAMASGLPVLSFAVGDLPQMVAPANYPFAAIALSDDDGFLKMLDQLAASPGIRRQIGDANQVWVRSHYDQKLMVERYLEIFG